MPEPPVPLESRYQIGITPPDVPPADDIFCRSCGVISEYHQSPGKGPHYTALTCSSCGSFIQWLPKPRPPRKPTEKQIAYLHRLGHQGPLPQTRKEASERISGLLRGKGVRYV